MIQSHIGFIQNYEVIFKFESFFHLSGQTFRLNYSKFYRCFCARVVVVVLVWVTVSSQYDDLVFVVVVRRLFVFERFERVKYIQSEIRNQVNIRHVVELESKVIIVIIIILNV